MSNPFSRRNAFAMGIGVMMFANEIDRTLAGSGHAWVFALLGSWIVLDAIWWRTTLKWEREQISSLPSERNDK